MPPSCFKNQTLELKLSLDQRTLSWLIISLTVLPIHPQLSFQEPRNPWPLAATMKVSWRAAGAWPCERLREAIVGGSTTLAIEVPGLNRLCREVEAWHHEEALCKVISESVV